MGAAATLIPNSAVAPADEVGRPKLAVLHAAIFDLLRTNAPSRFDELRAGVQDHQQLQHQRRKPVGDVLVGRNACLVLDAGVVGVAVILDRLVHRSCRKYDDTKLSRFPSCQQ